jgi:hypothetical protein
MKHLPDSGVHRSFVSNALIFFLARHEKGKGMRASSQGFIARVPKAAPPPPPPAASVIEYGHQPAADWLSVVVLRLSALAIAGTVMFNAGYLLTL